MRGLETKSGPTGILGHLNLLEIPPQSRQYPCLGYGKFAVSTLLFKLGNFGTDLLFGERRVKIGHGELS
jgi:hypothetical protein